VPSTRYRPSNLSQLFTIFSWTCCNVKEHNPVCYWLHTYRSNMKVRVKANYKILCGRNRHITGHRIVQMYRKLYSSWRLQLRYKDCKRFNVPVTQTLVKCLFCSWCSFLQWKEHMLKSRHTAEIRRVKVKGCMHKLRLWAGDFVPVLGKFGVTELDHYYLRKIRDATLVYFHLRLFMHFAKAHLTISRTKQP